jgi:Tol biopolymer transport system component
MSLAPGTRVGSYEILELVGAGGMGEVYRAHDPRLGRDVAIKVIPASFASDPDRVRRFEQEARAAAALTHPNILAVHDVGSQDGSPYIVSELLAGVTLRERMGGGALPVRKATDIAVQIAHGLAAAHAKGIVHRDLKPENVFITDDGHVKILDFGLAKLTEVTPVSGSVATKQADTQPGAVMGTAGYMSPEQLRGQTVDHRSDIFAFGAVLYELLAGARAFRGETSMDVATAILKEDPPDLPAVERHIPPALTRIVDRCLEKNPGSRFQSAGDLAFALDALSGSQTSMTEAMPVATEAPPRRKSWAIVAGVAVGAGAVVMYGITRLLQPAPEPTEATSFPLTLPAGVTLVTTGGGTSPGPLAISPNGRMIAMLATNKDGARTIWVRALNAVTPRQLSGTEDALSPFWSPDSRYLAFFAGRRLKKVDVSGGPPIDLCESGAPLGGSWSRHGVIIFGVNRAGIGLQRVADAGGEPTPLTTVEAGEVLHSRPYFLPDGRRFVFRALVPGGVVRHWVYLGSLDSPDRSRLVETESSNTVYSAGHLLFLRGSTLMAQPFDPDRATVSGDAYPVAESLHALGQVPVGMFSASPTGVLVFQSGTINIGSELVWFDRKGNRLNKATERGLFADVRISRDGTRATYSKRSEGTAVITSDIWMLDTTTGRTSRATFDAGIEYSSAWSADGKRFAFNSNRHGAFDIFMQPWDLSSTETELWRSDQNKFPADWTVDGKHLLVVVSPAAVRGMPGEPGAPPRGGPSALPELVQRLWALPLEGDRKAFPVTPGTVGETPGGFSPDPAGRWLTYASSDGERSQVYVVPFPPTGSKWQITTAGGNFPRWSHDGQEIFFLQPGLRMMMMAARVDARGSAVKVIDIKPLFPVSPVGLRGNYGVTPDGRFLINVPVSSDQPATLPPPTVVINWPAWRGK